MKKNEKLIARLFQLEIELETIQKAISQLKKDTKNDESVQQIEEAYNQYIKAIDEYRIIESALTEGGERVSIDVIQSKYSDVKELLMDESLKEASKEVVSARYCITSCKDCITSCKDCVTSACVQCVTSACVQCVINGSGNLCSISTLVASPCRPKPDIGEQLQIESIEKMKINWRSKK